MTSFMQDAGDSRGFFAGQGLRWSFLALCGLALAGCASQDKMASRSGADVDPKYGVRASPRVVEDEHARAPKGGGVYRVGKPYTVGGRRYVPHEKHNGYTETGVASWYGKAFHGRLTANGEIYDQHAISAAHRTMPMPSYARVTNLRNGHSIIVRVNDRGPYHHNRVIDLSSRTAQLLDFKGHGVARVKVDYVGRAPLDGSDDRRLEATLRTNGQFAPVPAGMATMVASAQPNFVPAQPRAPAIVENATTPPPMAGEIPVPADRPFELDAHNAAPAPRSFAAAAAPTQPSVAPQPRPAAMPATMMGMASVARPQAPVAATPALSYAPASGQVSGGRGSLY